MSATKKFIKKTAVISVLFFHQTVFAQNQDDHLEPVQGIFTEYQYEFEYYSKVRQILFNGLSDQPEVRIVTIPSFNPENVLEVERNKSNEEYYIVYHVADESIWYSKDKSKIKAVEFRKKINEKSAILIKQLFNSLILKTKYFQGNTLGLDGTNYYFSVENNGLKTGKIWSPDENSKMGKLVKITQELIALTKGEDDVIKFDQEFETEIKALIEDGS